MGIRVVLAEPPAGATPLGGPTVKGRNAPVVAYKVDHPCQSIG